MTWPVGGFASMRCLAALWKHHVGMASLPAKHGWALAHAYRRALSTGLERQRQFAGCLTRVESGHRLPHDHTSK